MVYGSLFKFNINPTRIIYLVDTYECLFDFMKTYNLMCVLLKIISMGREYFSPSNVATKWPRSGSSSEDTSANSNRSPRVARYFLPGAYLDQLNRLIRLLKAENVSDEQRVMELQEAINQRSKKITQYQETIVDVKKQMDYYNSL